MRPSAKAQSFATPPPPNSTLFWKGLAIIPVVLIHFLSAGPRWWYWQPPYNLLTLAVDQLGRFCVPLFLALSGYGLIKKFADKPIAGTAIFHQIMKLMPLYLGWSILLWLVLFFVPEWRPSATLMPLWRVILFGRADYQLYFVPLIVQLYLMLWLLSRYKEPTLRWLMVGALLIQVFWIKLIRDISFDRVPDLIALMPTFQDFRQDQVHYLWIPTWIGYFVFGAWLAKAEKMHAWLSRRWPWIWVLTGIAALWPLYDTTWLATHNTDIALATPFTRFAIVPFGVLWCLAALSTPAESLTRLPKWLATGITWLGKWSFVIYLSHTLLLRVTIGLERTPISLASWILGTSSLLLGLGLSQWWVSNQELKR